MSDTWIFNPPPMFPAPDKFTIPPRPEPNKLSTLQIILLTIVGIFAFIVGVYLWKHYKPDDEEEGDMKNNAPEIDLESNQRLSNSKVEAKRQLGSTKHVKKSAKKFNADEGDMVHGYDKRLSSSKDEPIYNENSKKVRYAKDTKKSKASKEELESEFGYESSSSQSEKDTKKRNASKENLESEFEEESSSSEGEKIHSRQSKKVNFARDSKKNNTSGRDARSSFHKF